MTERDLTLEFLVDQDPASNFETVKQETTVLADLIEKKKAADLSDKVIFYNYFAALKELQFLFLTVDLNLNFQYICTVLKLFERICMVLMNLNQV